MCIFIFRGIMNNYYIINNIVRFSPLKNTLENLSDGELIIINSPASRCFLILLQQQGEVISQQSFLDEVWQKRGIHVSANTYYQNISILRKGLKKIGLGDDIIVTLPRIGLTLATNLKVEVLPPTLHEALVPGESKSIDDSNVILSAPEEQVISNLKGDVSTAILSGCPASSINEPAVKELAFNQETPGNKTNGALTQQRVSFFNRRLINKLKTLIFFFLLIAIALSNLKMTDFWREKSYPISTQKPICELPVHKEHKYNS